MALLVPNHHVIVPSTADIAFTANAVSSGLTDTIQIELFGDSIMCGRDPDVAAPLCGVCNPDDPDTARVPEPPARLLEVFLPQYKLFITTRSQGNSTSGQLLNGNDGVNGIWPDNIEADIVIINHGMNDAKTGVPVAQYKQNLISLRQGLRSTQIMVWQTPTVNKYWDTSLYASAMREVAVMYGDLVADAHEFKTSFIGDVPDGLHPRQLGYTKLIDLCLSPKVNAAILRHITNQIPANTPHKFYRRDHQDKFVLENESQVALSFTPMSHRWVEVYYRDNISFRAVSRGLYDIGGELTSGVWDAKTGRKLVSTSRSYNLVKIRREDGKLIYNKNFDISGDVKESAALAAALNATSSDYIVVITTYDEPKTNRLTVGLLEAMYRCGASPEIFAASLFKLRSSYILVGIPGCGPGKGIEAYGGQVDAMTPCEPPPSPLAVGNLSSTGPKSKPKFYTTGSTWSEWSTLLNTYSIWEDTISGKIVSIKNNVSSYLNGALAVTPTYSHSVIGGTVGTLLTDVVPVPGIGYGTLNPSVDASPIVHWVINSTLTTIRDSAPTPGLVTLTNILFANIPGTQIPAIKVGTQGISYVSTSNANKLQLSAVLGQSYTIEAWIYAIAPGMIINKDAEYEVAVWYDGTIAVAIDWGTGADVNLPGGGWLLTTATVPFNAASHVAVVIDYTTMYIYINGILQFTQPGLDRSSQPSVNPVVLGNRPGAGQQFTGYIGDVRIWNVVRSASDILGNLSGTGLTMWNNVRFDVGVIPFLKNFEPDTCDNPTGDMIVIGGGVTQAQLTALGIQTPREQLRVVSPGNSVDWSVTFTVDYNCKIGYWVWDLNIGITSNITETIYSAVYNVDGRQTDTQSGVVDISRNFTSTSVMVFGMGDSNDGAENVTFTIESAILQPAWGGQYYQWDVFFPNKDTYTFELSADNTANIQITATPGTSNSFVTVMESVNFPTVVLGGNIQSSVFGYETIQQQTYNIPGCGWYTVRIFASDSNDSSKYAEYYPESVDQSVWSLMLNTYGIWQGNVDYTWDFFFTDSGDYTFSASIDNLGSIYIKEINDPVTVHNYEFVVHVPGYALITTATKFIKKGWHTIKINATSTSGIGGVGATIQNTNGDIVWTTYDVRNAQDTGGHQGVAARVIDSGSQMLWNTRSIRNAREIYEYSTKKIGDACTSYCEIEFDIASNGVPFAIDIFPPVPEAEDLTGNIVSFLNTTYYDIIDNVPPVNGTRLLNPKYATHDTNGIPGETFFITRDNKIKFSRPLTGIVTVVCDTVMEPAANAAVVNIKNIQSLDTYVHRFNPARWAPGTGNTVVINDTGALATPDVVSATNTNALGLYNTQLRLNVGDSHYSEAMVLSQPHHGYARITDNRRNIAYVPFPDYSGPDSFTYTLLTQTGQAGLPKSMYINVVGAIIYTYALVSKYESIYENVGPTASFRLLTNKESGSLVPYVITGISMADLDSINGQPVTSLSGNFTVGRNAEGFLLLSLKAKSDGILEAPETATVTLVGITPVVSANVRILDPVSYAIIADRASVNEGDTVTYTVNTISVPNGTVIYWTITGTASRLDFADPAMSGTVTINQNTATFSKTILADNLTEGPNTIIMSIQSAPLAPLVSSIQPLVAGPIVGSVTITINDTSLTPEVFNIAPNVSTITESGTVTYTVTTSGVASGTNAYWTMSGTVSAADFDDNQSSGSVVIQNNGATFTRALKQDRATEGTENLIISLRTGSVSGPVVATAATVTVTDTSLPPTYAIAPNVSTITESGTVTYTVTTSGVDNSTSLYWTLDGTMMAADFDDNLSSGSVVIQNNSATFTRALKQDQALEGTEYLIISLHSGSLTGPVVATAATVTVTDTSLPPTYSITPDVTFVYPGDTVTYTVLVTSGIVANGTSQIWTTTGTTGNVDFADGLTLGSVVINSGTATIARATVFPGPNVAKTIIMTLSNSQNITLATAATVTLNTIERTGAEVLTYWYNNRTSLYRNTAGYNSTPGSYHLINTYPGDDSTNRDYYDATYDTFTSNVSYQFDDPGTGTILSNYWTNINFIVGIWDPPISSHVGYGNTVITQRLNVAVAESYTQLASSSPPNVLPYIRFQWSNWDWRSTNTAIKSGVIGCGMSLPGRWTTIYGSGYTGWYSGANDATGTRHEWTVPAGCLCIVGVHQLDEEDIIASMDYIGPPGTHILRGQNTWNSCSIYVIVINTNSYDTVHSVLAPVINSLFGSTPTSGLYGSTYGSFANTGLGSAGGAWRQTYRKV